MMILMNDKGIESGRASVLEEVKIKNPKDRVKDPQIDRLVPHGKFELTD